MIVLCDSSKANHLVLTTIDSLFAPPFTYKASFIIRQVLFRLISYRKFTHGELFIFENKDGEFINTNMQL